jgi:hypothetical protein
VKRQRLACLSTIAAVCLSGGEASAVNGHSFSDAARARIDYRRATAAPMSDCAALMRLTTADVAIASAVQVPASGAVPAYCKVRGVIAPEIQFEVRLPAHWNRRFYMHGVGGYGGQPIDTFYANYRDAAVGAGFATATSNAGHEAENEPGASFAYRNLQKKIDWAYRSVHLTAKTAKALIAAYYDRPPAFSYFDGCSNGGRSGLIEAQRYPQDFDGIIAGAPLLNFTDTSISYIWTARALAETPIPAAKMKMIGEVVLARCDAADGLKDGLISDPVACAYDPAKDLPRCGAAPALTCVTDAEAATLAKIRKGPASKGRPYGHGVLPGSEPPGITYLPPHTVRTGWFEWVDDPRGPMSYQRDLGEQFVKYMAFSTQDPAASAARFDFDHDPERMSAGRQMVDALDADLSEFRGRGGKLLLYHGWADTGTNPLFTIDYVEQAAARNGGDESRDFMRLFLMPGVFHCFGGYGPDRLDAMTALVDWVEAGAPPDAIVATQTERRDGGRVVRSRPICAYPSRARYLGSGSPDEARNFACSAPGAHPR